MFVRILFFCAFMLTLDAFAFGQVQAGASVHFVTNSQNQPDTNNVGLGFRLGYARKDFYVGGEGAGNDSTPARSRYFGEYRALRLGQHMFAPGGGYFRFGSRGGGFGSLGWRFRDWSALGRFGSDQLAEGEVAYRLRDWERINLETFGRYTRHDDGAGNTRLFQIGLRLNFVGAKE